MLAQIEILTTKNEELNNKIYELEKLNLDLQLSLKFTKDSKDTYLNSLKLQNEKIEHYEKMFNYLTKGE